MYTQKPIPYTHICYRVEFFRNYVGFLFDGWYYLFLHTAGMFCMLAMGKQLTTHSKCKQAIDFYRVQLSSSTCVARWLMPTVSETYLKQLLTMKDCDT